MIYDGDYFVGSALNGDSLSHHGVPNQKWGVRNGPPYPVKRGSEVHYNVGKMTTKTKEHLSKTGKIAKSAAKSVGDKVKSSFQKWKEATKTDLATKDSNSTLVKNWQKKQLRISDMTNQELQQRIDRRKLEEMYRHALRGDFTDPKTWGSSKNGGKTADGKKAAESILKTFGNAAIAGIASGVTKRIDYSISARSKGRVDRREARRNAMSEVSTSAAKERAQYRAKEKNAAWKSWQETKKRMRDDDGAMDPIEVRPNYGRGLPTGSAYYAPPGSWTVR